MFLQRCLKARLAVRRQQRSVRSVSEDSYRRIKLEACAVSAGGSGRRGNLLAFRGCSTKSAPSRYRRSTTAPVTLPGPLVAVPHLGQAAHGKPLCDMRRR